MFSARFMLYMSCKYPTTVRKGFITEVRKRLLSYSLLYDSTNDILSLSEGFRRKFFVSVFAILLYTIMLLAFQVR